MATVSADERTPLSLYIDLRKGERADLEVVGKAAIEWVRMIQEAAAVIDPFLEVRVELVSGTEGSLNLNSILHAVRGVIDSPIKLKAIAAGVAVFFAMETASWAVNKGLDAIWEWLWIQIPELVESLTEDERVEVADAVTRIASSQTTQNKASKVYAELQRDPSVSGVGVSFQPGVRPTIIVPRSEFENRAGNIEIVTETRVTRITPSRVTLTLTSPALSDDDNKWRFRFAGKTLWALMDDEDFRARISPGSNSAPKMLIGIEMDVDLESHEELQENGTWKVIDHHVVRVRTLREPSSQNDFFGSAPKDD